MYERNPISSSKYEMKFSRFVSLKEDAATQDVETIFRQTTTDIDKLFGQLMRGTERMVRNSEKAKLPEELQKSILDDLQRIAAKVRSKPQNTFADPRNENVMVNTFVNSISEAVSAVSGLGTTGTGEGGVSKYDFKSTLTNARNLIMDRMNQLKSAVLKSISTVGDIHNKVSQIHGNTVSALSPQERESAEDALVSLAPHAKGGRIQLFADKDGSQPIPFSNNAQANRSALANVNAKQVFAKVGSRMVPLDLTNRQSVADMQSEIEGNLPKHQFSGVPDSDPLKTARKPTGKKAQINVDQRPGLPG